MKTNVLILAIASLCLPAALTSATEFHVSPQGNDANAGVAAAPFRTIQHAAGLAQPGDTITVHAGVYRERVDPPRGGTSGAQRITYQAAPGETVEITGSEPISGWVKVQPNVWKVILPNTYFGNFNPYNDVLHGDWYGGWLGKQQRVNHTGAVYLNGNWLREAIKLGDVMQPVGRPALWFAQVDGKGTTIWAQFKGFDPNTQRVEVNVRRTVFYPSKTGINYITVRGFRLCNAATPWAPPTAEQIGLIGTHWSKGWIIENNIISHSICSGIALGKYGDEWDNKSQSAPGYVHTIERALKNGWSGENIGHHIVRNNVIYDCEQAGIVGSLGAAFSTVTGNTIHDIHVRNLFGGAEMAGIKFHGAIDVCIAHNHICRTCLGLWLDWMAQGTRVSANLFDDNEQDMFVEVDHGPFLVDNNIFLSKGSIFSASNGGAFVHNLFTGTLVPILYDPRQTPFMKAHSTQVVGLHNNPSGDDRFYNNVFIGAAGLNKFDDTVNPEFMAGNVFFTGTSPSWWEKDPLLLPHVDPDVHLDTQSDGDYDLRLTLPENWAGRRTRKLVTTELLGVVTIPNLPYENADGTPLRVDSDFLGKERSEANPTPGPFENPGYGNLSIKVAEPTSQN